MMVVDSAVWLDFFNGVSNVHTAKLDRDLIEERDLAILPIVVTEVLQGFREDSGFRRAEQVLARMPLFQPSLETHIRAARLYRSLKPVGVSVRGAVDCVIAQTCIDANAMLLSPDADFKRISDNSRLRLWQSGD